jgi:hypothetical protein
MTGLSLGNLVVPYLVFYSVPQQPNWGPDRLIVQVSRYTHTHTRARAGTHTPVGLLSTSDQPVAEGATYTTHNKHKIRTSVASAGFEPANLASERPHTRALDRLASGICPYLITLII